RAGGHCAANHRSDPAADGAEQAANAKALTPLSLELSSTLLPFESRTAAALPQVNQGTGLPASAAPTLPQRAAIASYWSGSWPLLGAAKLRRQSWKARVGCCCAQPSVSPHSVGSSSSRRQMFRRTVGVIRSPGLKVDVT